MLICELFDRYRDKELSEAEQMQFESHLESCENCRSRIALLDNIVGALKQGEAQMPAFLPERISRLAFQQDKSWDAFIVSWLRPKPAWAVLTLLLIFSYLWLIPGYKQADSYSEYETLMNEADVQKSSTGNLSVNSDNDLVIWLTQGGGINE
jgi:anti-sigma factor ChrR (cupin superfamily)